MNAQQIADLMKKKLLTNVCFLGVQAGVTAMFGAPLTAAQVVDRIVADVRAEGDENYFTTLI